MIWILIYVLSILIVLRGTEKDRRVSVWQYYRHLTTFLVFIPLINTVIAILLILDWIDERRR